MRWMRGRFRGPASGRVIIALLVVAILSSVLFMVVDKNISPVLITMAESSVRSMAVKAMNDAVRSVMANPLQYSDLIKIIQDNTGKITMVQANTVKMNDIATSTSLTTQENIAKIGSQGVGIPIGTVLGGQLLSGRGPKIYARILPIGAVTTDFESEFQNQGINQTRHKIYLNVHTSVKIVIPMQSKQVDVDTKVLVTECIIIGEVPEYFANVTDPNYLPGAPNDGPQ